MARNKKLLTKAEYATRIGVNRSQITRYCQRGMPAHAGMIDPEEADWWREQNLDPTKPKAKVTDPQKRRAVIEKEAAAIDAEAKPPAAKATPKKVEAAPDATDAVSGVATLRGVRLLFPDGTQVPLEQVPPVAQSIAVKEFWNGEMRRREVLAHDREHIPRGDIEAAVDVAIGEFRGQFEGFAGLLSTKLAGKSAAEAYPVIQDEVRRVLSRLTEGLRKLAAGIDAMPDGVADESEDD